jgi:peptide/nickel transport system substrate-binding protein
MRKRLRLLSPLLVVGLVAAAGCADDDDGGGGTGSSGEFPRSETLFTGGNQWGPPSSWSPLPGGGQATGVRGLLYETPFVFNPFTTELEPWLAETGEWVSDTEYDLTLREGIEWTDGEPMTADDIVFSVEIAREPSVRYANVFDFLEGAEAVDELTTRFTFTEGRKGEFDNFLNTTHIIPEHIWSEVAPEDLMTVANDAGELSETPIGSGPYKYNSHTEDRMVWERNDDWWGTEALGMEMAPRFIIDLVNPSNEVAFAQILQNDIDISNFFMPGVDQVVGGDFNITTYYPEPPYMLSANTAYLIPNVDREPMDDPALRRALAFSIDVGTIVENVYANIVLPASPTGLLPAWEQYVDDQVVTDAGFAADMAQSYNPDTAKQILADAGYEDTNGDGLVETPDGEEFELTLIVPAGWTDWNEAANVIAEGARAAGINVVTDFPEAATLDDLRTRGEFDLVVNNWTELASTPWTTYKYLYQLPVQENQPNANFGRFEDDEAWELTQQLGLLSVGEDGFQEVISQLEAQSLEDMSAIPMWYNGLWSQVNNSTWTNWPSSDSNTPTEAMPTTWSGMWEKGGIYWLAEIRPAGGE